MLDGEGSPLNSTRGDPRPDDDDNDDDDDDDDQSLPPDSPHDYEHQHDGGSQSRHSGAARPATPATGPPLRRKGGRKPIYITTEERKQRNRKAQAAFRERRSEHTRQLEAEKRGMEGTIRALQLELSRVGHVDECALLRYQNGLLQRVLLDKNIDFVAEIAQLGMVYSPAQIPATTTNAITRGIGIGIGIEGGSESATGIPPSTRTHRQRSAPLDVPSGINSSLGKRRHQRMSSGSAELSPLRFQHSATSSSSLNMSVAATHAHTQQQQQKHFDFRHPMQMPLTFPRQQEQNLSMNSAVNSSMLSPGSVRSRQRHAAYGSVVSPRSQRQPQAQHQHQPQRQSQHAMAGQMQWQASYGIGVGGVQSQPSYGVQNDPGSASPLQRQPLRRSISHSHPTAFGGIQNDLSSASSLQRQPLPGTGTGMGRGIRTVSGTTQHSQGSSLAEPPQSTTGTAQGQSRGRDQGQGLVSMAQASYGQLQAGYSQAGFAPAMAQIQTHSQTQIQASQQGYGAAMMSMDPNAFAAVGVGMQDPDPFGLSRSMHYPPQFGYPPRSLSGV